jgi:hypothetical protein
MNFLFKYLQKLTGIALIQTRVSLVSLVFPEPTMLTREPFRVQEIKVIIRVYYETFS